MKGANKTFSDLSEFMRTADKDKDRTLFKTGLIGLNQAVGTYGGIPGGSIIQLLGNEKCGKSTLALDIVANAQQASVKEIEIKIGKETKIINAAYVDFERSFDSKYASLLGVDLDKLLIIETPYAEQSFTLIEHLLTEGLQMIVVDSIAMFVPQSESDKEMDDNEKMAAAASILSRALKRLIPLTDSAGALVILINQFRANISPMARKESKPFGARMIQYAVKLTIELSRIKNEDTRTEVKAYISKTKFGREGQIVNFDIIYGEGPDYYGHLLTLALEYGIIEKAGSWYRYNGIQAQGLEQAKEKFNMDEIKQKVDEYVTAR